MGSTKNLLHSQLQSLIVQDVLENQRQDKALSEDWPLLAIAINEYLADEHPNWCVKGFLNLRRHIIIDTKPKPQNICFNYIIIDINKQTISTYHKITGDKPQNYTELTILPQITKMIEQIESCL